MLVVIFSSLFGKLFKLSSLKLRSSSSSSVPLATSEFSDKSFVKVSSSSLSNAARIDENEQLDLESESDMAGQQKQNAANGRGTCVKWKWK